MTPLDACHVISLARRPERREAFLRRNGGKAGFVFVEAVDGRGIEPGAAPAGFTPGAVGCALSHRAAWEACAESGRTLVVMEDDACLAVNFRAEAEAALDLAGHCDILWFGYNLDLPLALHLAPGVPAVVRPADAVTAGDGWLDAFAATPGVAAPRAAVLRPALLWGLLAYAVTPAGAARLLDGCFPLGVRDLTVPGGQAPSRGIDGAAMALVQAGAVTAACCFPPIAISANDLSDTEAVAKRRRPIAP
ncbi:MAG: glycosyltransferase family 25 protein [Pseudomonadota bacterium]